MMIDIKSGNHEASLHYCYFYFYLLFGSIPRTLNSKNAQFGLTADQIRCHGFGIKILNLSFSFPHNRRSALLRRQKTQFDFNV